jgi:hypothetical protein
VSNERPSDATPRPAGDLELLRIAADADEVCAIVDAARVHQRAQARRQARRTAPA